MELDWVWVEEEKHQRYSSLPIELVAELCLLKVRGRWSPELEEGILRCYRQYQVTDFRVEQNEEDLVLMSWGYWTLELGKQRQARLHRDKPSRLKV